MRGSRSTQLAELSKHGCLSRPCPGPSCNPSPLLLPCAGVGNAPLAEAQMCRLGPGTAASHGACGRRGSRPRVQGFQWPGPAVRHAVVARSSRAFLVVTAGWAGGKQGTLGLMDASVDGVTQHKCPKHGIAGVALPLLRSIGMQTFRNVLHSNLACTVLTVCREAAATFPRCSCISHVGVDVAGDWLAAKHTIASSTSRITVFSCAMTCSCPVHHMTSAPMSKCICCLLDSAREFPALRLALLMRTWFMN